MTNMMDEISRLIKTKNLHSHHNQGILIAKVSDAAEGIDLAKDILYALTTTKTMLYLSGGRTPKEFYTLLAKEERIQVGAIGLVDERFGKKFHDNSNEKMLQETGILRYIQMKDIPFYPILSDEKNRKITAEAYDKIVRELHSLYQKNIGILGIGLDGHTAGIAGNRHDFTDPLFDEDRKLLLVSEFDDPDGMFGERVTMTFLGLAMLDLNIVLVFGDDKKDALEKMLSDGSEKDVPSRFFKRPEIAHKTLLITDQMI
jgi:6-phosphogluconolactonase/glucosamine-6-phosphate isomerase/deaminase